MKLLRICNLCFTMLKRKLSKQISAQKTPCKKSSRVAASTSTEESEYFSTASSASNEFSQQFLNIQIELNAKLKPLDFKPPVAYVYNPLEYAFKGNETYVKKYCQGPKNLLFVGMNPGPFGMVQTGVPFGEIKAVREWLQIEEEIGQPERVCPQRPVLGFACKRSEVSGFRFWNFLKDTFGTPETFFTNCFVYNYCPLALMKSDGGNLTPRDIKDTQLLENICDTYFYKLIQVLRPQILIGIGEYAEKRCLSILKQNNDQTTKVLRLPHPSPRAKNNQNWSEKAADFFKKENLMQHILPVLRYEQMDIQKSEEEFMDKAFSYAHEALALKEVPVGCIFVFECNIIAQGRNTVNETRNATRHAEINCIDQIVAYCKVNSLVVKDVFRSVSVYVTVEPCIMCLNALFDLEVKSIVFGCKNDRFGGHTVFDVASVRNVKTIVKGGYRADEAMALLKEFYKGVNPSAPPSKVKSRGKK